MCSSDLNCLIDFRCVASESGLSVAFVEPNYPEHSGMVKYADNGDDHAGGRMDSKNVYMVETISLNDLLAEHGAPREMSYLSIDTEGSELSILEGLDFARYKFKVITVEHNFVKESRDGIKRLLESHGYVRKYEHISLFDDWYVLAC